MLLAVSIIKPVVLVMNTGVRTLKLTNHGVRLGFLGAKSGIYGLKLGIRGMRLGLHALR